MGTSTSTFGVSRRENHDATGFYDRFDAPILSDDKTVNVPDERAINHIWHKSSEFMPELDDNTVSLMVTSPPYHAGKDYDTSLSFDEYLDLLHRVFSATYRVLQPGGRAAINVANLGRKPYIPLTSYCDALCMDIGFLPRAQIVWIKAKGASGSCAWGTFDSAKNPVLRDVHEYILVYSKGDFGRATDGKSTIGKRHFLRDTLSTWEIPPESAKRIGHPAPFPVELPRRLINLYTFEGELVLDPFMGAGSTAVAAVETRRDFIGYDTSQEYIELANARIQKAQAERLQTDKNTAQTRAWREKNPGRNAELQKEWRQKRIQETYQWVDSLKLASGCVDCGYNFSPIALDFDHVTGEKIAGISQLIHNVTNWQKIEEEIAKCVVRCSNCHRIKTWKKEE